MLILTSLQKILRILITEDRDFCELVFRDKKPTFGIILVRISDEKRSHKVSQIENVLESHIDRLPHAMTTLTLFTMKIRSL